MKKNKQIELVNDKIRKYQNIENVVMMHVIPILIMFVIIFLISIGMCSVFDVEEILGDIFSILIMINLFLIGVALVVANRMVDVVYKLIDKRDVLFEKIKRKK